MLFDEGLIVQGEKSGDMKSSEAFLL